MSYLRCSARLYPQSFVGGLMSYLRCSARLYLQLFVGGRLSYLCSASFVVCLLRFCLLPPVVCRRAHVLFTFFVFVWFVFTSSCL